MIYFQLVFVLMTEDSSELLMIEDDEDVVMATTDAVSRKRKAVEMLDDAASTGDFVTVKKLCSSATDPDSSVVD